MTRSKRHRPRQRGDSTRTRRRLPPLPEEIIRDLESGRPVYVRGRRHGGTSLLAAIISDRLGGIPVVEPDIGCMKTKAPKCTTRTGASKQGSGGGSASRQSQAAAAAQRRRRGRELVEMLPGATEFTDDPELNDPVVILRTLKAFPQLLGDLVEATTFAKRYGRKRLPGKWCLIWIAMVMSGEVDVERFVNRYRSSAIWKVAGFKTAPTVQTAWNRLTELEPAAGAFVEAANKLIQQAIKHEPRVAENVWVDATGFETHARLEHACTNRKACRAAGGNWAKHPELLSAEEAKTERHKESAEAPPSGDDVPGALEEVPEDKAPDEKPPRRRRPYRYLKIGGHLFRTLDPDAGARTYDGPRRAKRFWFGGLEQAAVSMYVGAPLAINILPANEAEHAHWPELFKLTATATGGVMPGAVVMDRAYSRAVVFKHNTELGVASVIPWRKPHQSIEREDMDSEWCDRHGVPRCKHCGAPGDATSPGLGFYRARGKPRIRFRCEYRCTPDCNSIQTVACEREWTLLTPLSRLSEPYHALSKARQNLERVFRHGRDRYTVAGTGVDTRPKRPGLAWQELRAVCAQFCDWLLICLRHGWLGSHKRRNGAAPIEIDGKERLARVLSSRQRNGLELPYGPAAEALGLANGGGGPPPDDKIPL